MKTGAYQQFSTYEWKFVNALGLTENQKSLCRNTLEICQTVQIGATLGQTPCSEDLECEYFHFLVQLNVKRG